MLKNVPGLDFKNIQNQIFERLKIEVEATLTDQLKNFKEEIIKMVDERIKANLPKKDGSKKRKSNKLKKTVKKKSRSRK